MIGQQTERIAWADELEPGVITILESGHRVMPEFIEVSALVSKECPRTDVIYAGPSHQVFRVDVDGHLPGGDPEPDCEVHTCVDQREGEDGRRAFAWIKSVRRIDGEKRDAFLPPESRRHCLILAMKLEGAKAVLAEGTTR